MLEGLLQVFADSQHPPLCGWVNVPAESSSISAETWRSWPVHVCEARPRGFNQPTREAVDGTREILRLVDSAKPTDLVINLLSGGGSALLCSPCDGLTLDMKVQLTQRLSSAGANIAQLNSVRRCLSDIKGGGLARRCNANELVTFVISDVLGDPIELIASGPTVLEPPPNPEEALAVLHQFCPGEIPLIESMLHAQWKSTKPKRSALSCRTNATNLILANNATAVDAAGVRAVALGYQYWMHSARSCEGDAESIGRKFARQMIDTVDGSHVDCLISGGEPTVTLPQTLSHTSPASEPSGSQLTAVQRSGFRQPGMGGRNQHLALAFCDEWLHNQSAQHLPMDFVFLSGGTDGEDGPTPAAGAWVDMDTIELTRAKGLDTRAYLQHCDSYRFFEATDSVLLTGATNTNVCDLRVGLLDKYDVREPR